MECFGTTDFDNNSRLITLSAIIISGLHCGNSKQVWQIPDAACTDFSSWWWAEKSPETCTALTIIKSIIQRCILSVMLKNTAVSFPGQCIPMSSLGHANPGKRAQLTDCVFSITFVAFRHLSIPVTDAMYTYHMTSASELGRCAGTSFERHSVKTLLVWTAHLSSNRDVGSAGKECREYHDSWLFS